MNAKQIDNKSGICFTLLGTFWFTHMLLLRHEAFLMVIYDHHKIVEKETDVSGCV